MVGETLLSGDLVMVISTLTATKKPGDLSSSSNSIIGVLRKNDVALTLATCELNFHFHKRKEALVLMPNCAFGWVVCDGLKKL